MDLERCGLSRAALHEDQSRGWLFAALFAIEGLLLLWEAARGRSMLSPSRGSLFIAGVVLSAYALAYPLLSLSLAHAYPATPTFGVPCPTAILTIGALLCMRDVPLRLVIIPAIWALIGGSAALLFGVWTDYALLAAGALLVGSRVLRTQLANRS